ncbi:MAG: DUF4013 domain-containing protein [Natrialbaceae archaeon]|nr:DUF4013 domain-containing protein [Natrialbaceae archaeon]
MGGLFVSSILYLIFSYVTVAAIVNYAREEEISAGFDISMLTDVLTTSEYAMGWLLGVGIIFVAGIVVSVVSIVPLIGAIAGIFINFYALIVAFRIWGRAVDDALTAGGSVGTSAGQPAE